MTEILKCKGFKISRFDVPPFNIQSGHFYQINVPFQMGSPEDKKLNSFLLGKSESLSIEFYNIYPIYTGQIYREPKRFLEAFQSSKVNNRLSKFYGVSKENIEPLLFLHNINGNKSWDELSLVQKCIISFEIASICSLFLFFDTAGLDPLGIEKMFSLAIQKCNNGHSIVHLSYPLMSDNSEKKDFIFVKKG